MAFTCGYSNGYSNGFAICAGGAVLDVPTQIPGGRGGPLLRPTYDHLADLRMTGRFARLLAEMKERSERAERNA